MLKSNFSNFSTAVAPALAFAMWDLLLSHRRYAKLAILFSLGLVLQAGALAAQGSCPAEGGELAFADGSTSMVICADDGIPDPFTPTLSGVVGQNSVWLVTTSTGEIVGVPPGPTFDFEGQGDGACFLYNLAFQDGFTGDIAVGDNICNLDSEDGCFDLSNYILVVRRVGEDCNVPCEVEGGDLVIADTEETLIEICAGDGVSDAFDVDLSNESGPNSGWIVTDLTGLILALPPSPPFDLDGAGPGICLVYHISFEDGLEGLEQDGNVMDLDGCFSLSNFIQVNRNQPDGGMLEGGPFEFTSGDGNPDMIPEDGITVTGSDGESFQWVVTDGNGIILGLPPTFSAVDFDGAGAGNCLVWYLAFFGELEGVGPGLNANDIEGCFDLSNPIEVIRTNEGDCQANGGDIFGGPFEFTSGDGQPDMIPEGAITVANSQGENFQWIVTDGNGIILGLPPTFSAVDFDGAGAGNCLVWYSRFDGEVTGLMPGLNANDIVGCFDLSNPIEVIRTNEGDCQANGGDIFGGPFEFTSGDGNPDMIPEGAITVANSQGEDFQWIVTDGNGIILGLPPTFSAVDFDGAGAGNCLVWYSRFDGEVTGLMPGLNANDIEGCFDLSNPIEVIRTNEGDCQANGGDIFGGPFEFTSGDGQPDMIPEGAITVANSQGENFQWIVTDGNGIILGLPPTFSAVDFDGAGAGNCLVWYSRFDGEVTGLMPGLNANDIEGCFDLSNPIEVIRTNEGNCQANGGDLFGGPFEFTSGDGQPDMIPEGAITVANSQGENFQWIVTDGNGIILGLPPTFSAVDFDGAGAGNCLVWYSRFDGEVTGLMPGLNANDIEGCFDLSNPIEVIRTNEGDCQANGGDLFGGPFEFTSGDGQPDMIPEGAITVANAQGENFQWVVTDGNGIILGLPPTFSAVDFDGAGAGNCLVWYLAFDGELEGVGPGLNANDIVGCFDLSNPIEVIRTNEGDCQANGGDLFGGPFEFTSGDGQPDMIPEGAITVANSQGDNFQWIVTDGNGIILGLPPTFSAVDFDGAGAGNCLVWYSRFDGEVTGLMPGLNANDIEGCFDLSNPIEVIRTNEGDCQANGGDIFGGPFEFTSGDGQPDMIPEGAITVANSQGENFQWIVTDGNGIILGLPPTFSAVDFDGAGAGNCLVWYSRFDGEVTGLIPGLNANDIEGCFDLSNPIEVIRTNEGDCQANGGDIFGGPFEFTSGDGQPDMIPEGAITVANSQGENFQWIVTDGNGIILGLPPTFSAVDFDGAGAGNCLVWYLAFDGELEGVGPGLNANDIVGCFDLSNPIEVIRTNEGDCQANGGDLFGGPFEFTSGDGQPDMIPEGAITVANSQGENFQWIVTDGNGIILGLPPTFSAVDFDGAGAGNCLVWYSRFDGEVTGLMPGLNANDIEGCFDLSNPIEVIRTNEGDCQANGGDLFGGPFEFTSGDGQPDMIPEGAITVANAQGENFQWVVTDGNGIILGLPPTFSAVDFDGAGAGNCLVWYLAFDGELEGVGPGLNANDIVGCFDLSNPIEVIRTNEGDCQANGGDLFGGPFEFTSGDGQPDMIPEGAITVANAQGENFQWVVTDGTGIILGLPPTFSAVDFDGAGAGNCLVWYSRFDGEVTGLMPGLNANDIEGCFDLSNPIEVIRTNEGDCQANGGDLFGGPFEFTSGDGQPDMIPEGAITVANAQGENFQWVVTDDEGFILGLPENFSDVDFDGAGEGLCLVWYLAFDGEIVGLEPEQNANDLMGCFDLSNPIEVNRVAGDGFQLGRVVLSEVDANGQIEIFNGTDEMVPLGSWWLCNFPTYRQLSSLTVECGDLNLEPGEVVVVSGFTSFDPTDAELGLYETNSFGSSDAIRDYLEWGSSGHGRSGVAIAAGIWEADFFVNIPSGQGLSLQQSLNDADELEWFEELSTFCMPNLNRPNTTSTFDPSDLAEINVFPNPATSFLQVETLQFGAGQISLQLLDMNGRVMLEQKNDFGDNNTRIDLSNVASGQYVLSVRSASAFKATRIVIR